MTMNFFRRGEREEQPAVPARGPGGGRLRPRPQRRALRRRRLGPGDYALMGVIGFVLAFAVTRLPFFGYSIGVSLLEGLAVAAASIAWMYWRESRKPRTEPPRKKRR
jgi:hypothetical protein